ncbi:unnamed protein product [Trichobilharzia regenti]|nr:unnamed protein product [Trichobilharzia regenti]
MSPDLLFLIWLPSYLKGCIHSSVISQSDTSSTATPPTAHPVNGTVIPTNMMNGNGLIYATPQPQRNHVSEYDSRFEFPHSFLFTSVSSRHQ